MRLSLAVLLLFILAPVAAGAAPPLEIYGRLPAFERAAMSPSGDRIATIAVIGEQRQLTVVDRSNKRLTAVGVGERKVRGVYWAGEDIVLLHLTDTVSIGMGFTTGRAELSSTLIVPVSGGAISSVFDRNRRDVAGGTRGLFGITQRGGQWYGYFGGLTLDRRTKNPFISGRDLYEVDLQTGKASRIARQPEDATRDWVIGPDGQVAASLDFFSRSGMWTLRAGISRDVVGGRAPTGDVALLGLGRTPGTALYFANDDEGTERIFEIPLSGGPATELLATEPVSSYLFDPRSLLFTGYVRDGDVPEDRFFDARRDKLMANVRKTFAGVTVRLIDHNDAFDRLIVQTNGIGHPEGWWLVDLKAKTADPIGVGYAVADIGPMRMFEYSAADGLEMAGVLTLPPGRTARGLPLVVMPHGGPTARDYPRFNWWAQAYASRGYAVFQPNFRGSTGSSAAFRIAGHGEWGRKMQTDISDGVAALAREGIVDPKRACIVGASYGGYAALAGVTLQQGLYRCAVSVAGVADVASMVETDIGDSGGDWTATRALKAEIGRGRDLKAVSPTRFADRADAPILLIHGADDTVVPFSQSRAMADALGRADKPFELIELKGEDHWLSRSETRLSMLRSSVAFVEKHNPPDPAPNK